MKPALHIQLETSQRFENKVSTVNKQIHDFFYVFINKWLNLAKRVFVSRI